MSLASNCIRRLWTSSSICTYVALGLARRHSLISVRISVLMCCKAWSSIGFLFPSSSRRMYLTTFLFPGFLPNKLMFTVCKRLWGTLSSSHNRHSGPGQASGSLPLRLLSLCRNPREQQGDFRSQWVRHRFLQIVSTKHNKDTIWRSRTLTPPELCKKLWRTRCHAGCQEGQRRRKFMLDRIKPA